MADRKCCFVNFPRDNETFVSKSRACMCVWECVSAAENGGAEEDSLCGAGLS